MKNYFKKALTIFKYLTLLVTICYWVYIIYDDYIFIEKYGITVEGIKIWFLWYIVYFLGFSMYYWALCTVVIFVYHKIKGNK